MIKDLLWLRRTLLTYLEDVEQIKLIAKRTGFDLKEWDKPAAFIWNDVIVECQKAQLPILLQNILSLNAENEKIDKLDKEIKFQQKIEQALADIPLDYRKMGMLDTLNCGRAAESEDFWNPTDFGPDDSPLLTCIISGRTSEKPRSLADRLAFQFFEKIDSEGQGVCYLRDGNIQRIRPLRLNHNKEIQLHYAIDQYLESIRDLCCLCNYSVVAHLVEVDVEACGKFLYEVLDIIHERTKAFTEEHSVLGTLFIIFEYPDAFNSSHLHQHLQAKKGELQQVRYYRITKGVELQEIKNWFDASSSKPIDDLNKYLGPFLSFWLDEAGKKVFREKQTIPMGVMEKMQRHIFRAVMRREGENNTHGGQA